MDLNEKLAARRRELADAAAALETAAKEAVAVSEAAAKEAVAIEVKKRVEALGIEGLSSPEPSTAAIGPKISVDAAVQKAVRKFAFESLSVFERRWLCLWFFLSTIFFVWFSEWLLGCIFLGILIIHTFAAVSRHTKAILAQSTNKTESNTEMAT